MLCPSCCYRDAGESGLCEICDPPPIKRERRPATEGELRWADAMAVALRRAGMRQRDLADRMGLSQAAISGWVKHGVAPAPHVIFEAERQLGLHPGELSRHLGYVPVPVNTRGRNIYAVMLGAMGARVANGSGGRARAAKLTPERRREIAMLGVEARLRKRRERLAD